ncbi:MAG: pyridoxal phosphate-dependent aminotransferase [Candidatus Omnitrophica bacterium]|nr:pyridoxal phosphate-dependent aminotransferase [Candidatus Omnitrophota bacterium]MCF7891876.1 pyridoxal phosphate-dependent aminotransferase [Candidatus Omnitrophota bacterium]MCF7896092.1 pyridoxal phosphate-dependent aminotransferase [Candidatus Omnitrophota bacterium]MCF7897695.1 pyridoxal phosphate-dependent aminotransferase [Candidatus Omnitrophota bacterium]MCF7909483.1 pyridoxal phosphate-dependent aminotransferase [Candidatus Omnitrophota bacterium]
MLINPQVLSLTKSATLKITSLTKQIKKQGKDVVNFAAGEPDFDTPDFIKSAAKEAIDQGFTKYTPSSGDNNLKKAIADKLKSQNNIPVESENIIVTSGAKYAIFIALLSLASREDEILIPLPYWVSYPEMVKLTPGKARFIELPEENNFKLTPELLKKSITAKTKALIFNYPNNPTGTTYSKEELLAISEVIKDAKITVISDEIYEALVYDKKKHTSLACLNSMQDHTITIGGFSKSFSMTGWRVGYLAASNDFIKEASKIVGHTTSCPCSISQAAAIAALEGKEWQSQVGARFEERRDLLYKGLDKIAKIRPLKPEGTFYMFSDIRETGLNSLDFCSRLLEEELVSCIPASAFGKEGFIRISFSTSLEQIKKGIDRISRFISTL